MSRTKKAVAPETGRKAAYVMRNRVALLRSTQEVLSAKGQAATIEDIAEHAQVAVSTIYKHFRDKDALIEATLLFGFKEWEEWAESFVKDSTDPLERLVFPMRLFVRTHQTHPHHAQSIVNYFDVIAKILPVAQEKMVAGISTLAKAKIISCDDPMAAAQNMFAVMSFSVVNQVNNPKETDLDRDETIRIALGMLGISEAKARKLTGSKITNLKI
jgi:AcrR family transcriptional regulator